jgi:hypothetical protein
MATLIVKLTRDQHRQIKREAKERSTTMSGLVRWRMFRDPLPSTAPTGSPERKLHDAIWTDQPPFDGGPEVKP